MSESTSAELARLHLERDFFLRLFELDTKDDLLPLLEGALTLICEITRAAKGYLSIDGAPPFVLTRGFTDAEVDGVRREISTGIIAEALATGRTISTSNAREDPRFKDQKSVQKLRLEAVLCAPIGGAQRLGVLYLEGRGVPSPFPEEDRAHAELFARHLAPLADRLLVREERAAHYDFTAEYRAKLAVEKLIGTSRKLAEVLRQIGTATTIPLPVLITGESGTGKTAVARAIHDSSARAHGPFVEVNCTAVPEALFESELFGAEKGAHSTATKRIDGKIDAARGGTLLLDEVGDLPLGAQGKLLMFLQSRRYYRLGSSAAIEADVRVIAATNADLEERVAEKVFREDLFYRLNVLQVQLPPLRERREDIEAIAESIVRAIGEQHARAVPLSGAARVAIAETEWPGNVRQLENALQRGWATAVSEGATAILPKHLFPALRAVSGSPEGDAEVLTYEDALRLFRAEFLAKALEAHGWNIALTARKIGLARSHVNDLIRAHGLLRKAKK
jgi:Nif-specific regulatory protein